MAHTDQYRLPRTIVPSRYTLILEPDLAEATFSGSVTIDVDVTSPTNEILLNALDLNIADAAIVS
ncbi:MAG: hypothetical protein ACC652_07475, partial [Acidimicrobiales bacterium]